MITRFINLDGGSREGEPLWTPDNDKRVEQELTQTFGDRIRELFGDDAAIRVEGRSIRVLQHESEVDKCTLKPEDPPPFIDDIIHTMRKWIEGEERIAQNYADDLHKALSIFIQKIREEKAGDADGDGNEDEWKDRDKGDKSWEDEEEQEKDDARSFSIIANRNGLPAKSKCVSIIRGVQFVNNTQWTVKDYDAKGIRELYERIRGLSEGHVWVLISNIQKNESGRGGTVELQIFTRRETIARDDLR